MRSLRSSVAREVAGDGGGGGGGAVLVEFEPPCVPPLLSSARTEFGTDNAISPTKSVVATMDLIFFMGSTPVVNSHGIAVVEVNG